MKEFKITNMIIITYFFTIMILGCTAPSLKSKIEIEDEIITGEEEIAEVAVKMDSPYVYHDEEPILEEILKNYEEAVHFLEKANIQGVLPEIEDLLEDEWLEDFRLSSLFSDFIHNLEKTKKFSDELKDF